MNHLRDPQNRVRAAWVLLVVSIIAWPLTAMTVFKDEPQGILGLSWAAIILQMLILVSTTDIRDNQ